MRGSGRLEGTRIGRVGLSCSGTRRGQAWPGPASPQHRGKTKLRAARLVTMRLHFGAGGNRVGLMRGSRRVARHRCAGPRQMHGRRSGGSISCCVVSYHAAAGMNKQQGGAWGLGGGAGWAERSGAATGCRPRHAGRPSASHWAGPSGLQRAALLQAGANCCTTRGCWLPRRGRRPTCRAPQGAITSRRSVLGWPCVRSSEARPPPAVYAAPPAHMLALTSMHSKASAGT